MEKETLKYQGGGENVTYDVYSIIRSAEIREYFQKEDCMGIFEKEQLINHSLISLQQKETMLKQLAQTGNEEEKVLVEEMSRIYRECIKQIYHPVVRTVFLLECTEQRWEDNRIEKYTSLEGVFDTADDAVEEMARIYKGSEEESYGYVTVLQVPEGVKVKETFGYTLFWIDGKWQAKSLYITMDRLEALGISEDTVFRFDTNSCYHPLPFKNGDRLKFRLPFMKDPFCGVIWSEKDGNGCWYHWLNWNNEEGACINLTDLEFFPCSGYSTLDWVVRA